MKDVLELCIKNNLTNSKKYNEFRSQSENSHLLCEHPWQVGGISAKEYLENIKGKLIENKSNPWQLGDISTKEYLDRVKKHINDK